MSNAPQWSPAFDGVIQWGSFGEVGAGPAAGTGKRLFQRWQVFDAAIDNVFIWQNSGSGGVTPEPSPTGGGAGGKVSKRRVYAGPVETWADAVKARFEKRHLEKELGVQTKALRQVEKQVKAAEKKVKAERPAGILANLDKLTFKKLQIESAIQDIETKLVRLDWLIDDLDVDDDDEEMLTWQ